jgi:hypothetical protein
MTARHRHWILTLCAATAGVAAAASMSQAASPPTAPRYTSDGKMEFPADYRTWIYLSTGMDMSYAEGPTGSRHIFDSVFVNREAYDGFLKTGTWPDKTVMVLEARMGQGRGSITKGGQFQTDRLAAEVHVKDKARFKDTGGWAFFRGDGDKPMTLIPAKAGCIACHDQHGAVDSTFVQFYPTLIPIAQAKKTFSASYLAEEAQAASQAANPPAAK